MSTPRLLQREGLEGCFTEWLAEKKQVTGRYFWWEVSVMQRKVFSSLSEFYLISLCDIVLSLAAVLLLLRELEKSRIAIFWSKSSFR